MCFLFDRKRYIDNVQRSYTLYIFTHELTKMFETRQFRTNGENKNIPIYLVCIIGIAAANVNNLTPSRSIDYATGVIEYSL